jgi:DHA1 family multidrug resistance protein-like MFS transporter
VWRRNLWATWFAELLAIMGFSAMFPIMPYYIQELGISGDAVARWSGIVTAAAALTMGVMGPIWGALSDRYGRKVMVVRAMFGGTLVIGLMGFVRNVEQLTVLRLMQGVLTGTVTAATTLVASATPRERLGETLGKLQLAVFLGQSFGPVTGGIAADTLGYRAVFWLTSAYLLISGLLVLTLVREEFTPAASKAQGPLWQRIRQNFALLFVGSLLGLVLGLRFALRLGLRMSTPLLPLLVQEILPAGSLLGSASGLLTSVSGIASAIAAPLLGRFADHHGGRGLLLACAFLSAIALSLQAFIPTYWLLIVAQVFLGFAIGGTLSVISAYIGRLAPEGLAGTAYGLDSTAVSMANAIGPLVGGWLADAQTLRTPFFVGGFLTALAGLGVLRLPQDGKQAAPAVELAQGA